MAIQYTFDNRTIIVSGAYSTIVSGEQSQPLDLDYGKVLVIDTGEVGATWGGGAGIDGAGSTGKDSVYRFTNLAEYQSFLKGGLLWKAAEFLFKPNKGIGARGVSEVIHVKAATTAKSTMTFTATGGGAAGGTFAISPIDEGVGANGVLTSTHLDKGYAYTIETGVEDTSKWIYKVWLGSWKGNHTDGIAYDEIAKGDTSPILIIQSPEFNNIQNLVDWANTNSRFGNYFTLETGTVTGTGAVDTADVTAVSGYNLSAGGTESYTVANLNLALEAVAEEQFDFIICDQYGTANYDSSEVDAITDFIVNDSRFNRHLYVGGGADEDEFDSTDGSIDMAAYYNSANVRVCHGNFATSSDSVSSRYRYWPTLVTAAMIVGRTAGKEPQVPITNKSMGADKLAHNLRKVDKEKALRAGVQVIVYNQFTKSNVLLQDVTTLQDSARLFTPAGKSYEGSIMRIIGQINKELIVNSEIDLLSQENGVNINTLSSGVLRSWTENYLKNKVANSSRDNLIVAFRNVTVSRVDDAHQVSYAVQLNSPINKLFFTGFLFK